MKPAARIALELVDSSGVELLQNLSKAHGWPVLASEELERTSSEPAFDFALQYLQGRLQLRDLSHPEQTPLSIDFQSGKIKHRLFDAGLSQPLSKAIGAREKNRFVLDMTAGLGVDAIYLATLGCRVLSVEKSPVLFALLEDGWRRACADEDFDASLKERLRFRLGNSVEVCRELREAPEVVDAADWMRTRPEAIYLDPMYPETKKSALPKKGMQMLRKLLGHGDQVEALLEAALSAARDRVVIKRPLEADFVLRKPTHSFTSKTVRFDMYKII